MGADSETGVLMADLSFWNMTPAIDGIKVHEGGGSCEGFAMEQDPPRFESMFFFVV